MLTQYIEQKGSETIVRGVSNWLERNLPTIVKPPILVGATVGGADFEFNMATRLSKALPALSKAIPVVGGVLDFGIQKAQGESTKDAVVKSVAHTVTGVAGAKIGAIIGTAIPVPVIGTLAGAAIGFLIGVGAGMLFDYIYDKGKK
jgi:hypothetical protein